MFMSWMAPGPWGSGGGGGGGLGRQVVAEAPLEARRHPQAGEGQLPCGER